MVNADLPFYHAGLLCSLDPDSANACGDGFRNEVAMAMAKASALAYCQQADIRKKLQDWGFNPKAIFFYSAGSAQAFLSFHPITSDALIAFRGTNEWRDLLTHLKVIRVPLWLGGRHQGEVHKGWHDAILTIWPKILKQLKARNSQRVWITGHSLGGAKAFIANHLLEAEDIDSTLYTFGAPKTGDERFAEQFADDQCFRIENQGDPVPFMPYFPLGFSPSGQCRILLENGTFKTEEVERKTKGISKVWQTLTSWFNNAFDAHSINEYMRRLALNEGVIRECSLRYAKEKRNNTLLHPVDALSSNQ